MVNKDKNLDEAVRFLSKFRTQNADVYIALLHESQIIAKNKLPKMIHFTMNVSDFIKAKKLSELTGVYITKKGKEQPIFINTQNDKQGRGVYFVVNPGGKASSEIENIVSYFLDADFGKESIPCESEIEARSIKSELEQTGLYESIEVTEKKGVFTVDTLFNTEEIENRKDIFRKKHPDLFNGDETVAETYSGFHIYFHLEVPDKRVKEFSRIQKALAAKFRTDTSVSNPARVMRIPGFLHTKYKKKFRVRMIVEGTKYWKTEELIDTFQLQLEKPQTKGVKSFNRVDINPYKKERAFYTEKKMIEKPDINFKKPSVPLSKRKEININAFLEEVTKRPFTDFIESPSMQEGPILCPFHNDTAKSAGIFVTNEEEYGFKCFACGVGLDGFLNIIGMYRQLTNCNYRDALEGLAAIMGYQLMISGWESEQYAKYRLNRRFLLKEDILSFYPNLWHFIKTTKKSSIRMDVLDFLNSYAEATLINDDFRYNDEQTFFVSFHHMERRLGKSITSIFRSIKLATLLKLVDNVPKEHIHPKLKIEAEIQREKGMWREKRVRELEGRPFNEDKYREVNFYIVPLWMDRIEEIEQMAKKLRELGFSIEKHLNKKGLQMLLSEDEANRVYPDERKLSKKTKRLKDVFSSIILKEIDEKGFFVLENITEHRIQVTEYTRDNVKKQRTLKGEEKIVQLKSFLPAIKNDLNLLSKAVKDNKLKLQYNFTKKKPKQITVLLKQKNK